MEKFDNFGQALAWMMESPENVATSENGNKYRWLRQLECDTGIGNSGFGVVDNVNLGNFVISAWSRAPREPLEFRGFGVSSASGWLGQVQLDGEVVNDIRCNALSRVPGGAEFELILKEKN